VFCTVSYHTNAERTPCIVRLSHCPCKSAPAMPALTTWLPARVCPFQEVEEFVKADPYVQNGLVPKYQVRPYMVVAGDSQ
jgi:hypothetical protein